MNRQRSAEDEKVAKLLWTTSTKEVQKQLMAIAFRRFAQFYLWLNDGSTTTSINETQFHSTSRHLTGCAYTTNYTTDTTYAQTLARISALPVDGTLKPDDNRFILETLAELTAVQKQSKICNS